MLSSLIFRHIYVLDIYNVLQLRTIKYNSFITLAVKIYIFKINILLEHNVLKNWLRSKDRYRLSLISCSSTKINNMVSPKKTNFTVETREYV